VPPRAQAALSNFAEALADAQKARTRRQRKRVVVGGCRGAAPRR
jgi:hypothetical protein